MFSKRFVDAEFEPGYISTIGVEFKIHTLKIGEKIVKLQLWDTAGQERFRAVTSSFYRGSHGVVMVYDCCDESTVDSLDTVWLEQIKRYM